MRPAARLWPWLVAAPVLVVGLTGIVLPALSVVPIQPLVRLTGMVPSSLVGARGVGWWQVVTVGLLLASSLGAGAALLSRRPDHPVSWLLWLPALYLGLEAVAEVLQRTVGPGSVLTWARWAAAAAWPPSFLPLAVHLPLLFPTGQPPTARWRWVQWTGAASVALLTVGNAVNVTLFADRMNPAAVAGPFGDVVQVLGGLLLFVSFAAATASAVARFRRARGVERQQLRWFVRAATLVPFAWAVVIVTDHGPYAQIGGVVLSSTLGLLPVAVAIAVLRYRLYDIDRIVSRTVTWAVLTAAVAALYTAVVVGTQMMVGSDVPDVAIALATLAAAALFQPLRRRVQAVVDRRFNRARYDAATTVEQFAQRLRDEFVPDQVTADLDDTVRRAVGPSVLSLWTPAN